MDDVCVCVEAPACADAKSPGSSRFAKHLPWSPWSAAGHLSRVLSVLRDSVLKVVEGSKEEPQVDVQPPKRQRGARTKPKMDVEAQQPSPRNLEMLPSPHFSANVDGPRGALATRGVLECCSILYANRYDSARGRAWRRNELGAAAAERRGGDKPALGSSTSTSGLAYRTDGGVAVATAASSSTRRRAVRPIPAGGAALIFAVHRQPPPCLLSFSLLILVSFGPRSRGPNRPVFANPRFFPFLFFAPRPGGAHDGFGGIGGRHGPLARHSRLRV